VGTAGIVPLINASIVLQLLSTTFPSLKKLQREEGPQVTPPTSLRTSFCASQVVLITHTLHMKCANSRVIR